jgi:hypothetical protein
MYRKSIGYLQRSRAAVLIPACQRLLEAFGPRLEAAIGDAYLPLTNQRFVKAADYKEFLLIASPTRSGFEQEDGQNIRDLLTVTFYMMDNAGYSSGLTPAYLTYETNALMTIDEVITECLDEKIHIPTADEMDGEKTMFNNFKAQVPRFIREVCNNENLRPWYLDHFRRYIGNLLFRLDVGDLRPDGLSQFDSTLLTHFSGQESYYNRSSVDGYSPYKVVVARDNDPDTAEVIARIRSVCSPDAVWLDYYHLLSNKDKDECIFTLGPVLSKLDSVIGYDIPVGPFMEAYMHPCDSLPWGKADELDGVKQRVQFLDKDVPELNGAVPRVPVARYNWHGVSATSSLTPISLSFVAGKIKTYLIRSANGLELTQEWLSASAKRLVSTKIGASTDTMILDLAFTRQDIGTCEDKTLLKNVDQITSKLVVYDSKVEARRIDIDRSKIDPVTYKNTILEKMYYVKNGRFMTDADPVDVSTQYLKHIGFKMYKPAFAEYFKPSQAWFLTEDAGFVTFIIGQLGLRGLDERKSRQAITVMHNVARLQRMTGMSDDEVDRLFFPNLRDFCRMLAYNTKS